ncbi:Loganic acid O-methyltransferase [Sesamum angolense]|uniref:Loganic acid O-methyltransferase n=1 Tax=Sesamum angolense TaxID=2727404 RepID=A0AAE1XEE0_9LAMI|nr:Loganic acid O-methyltransferase [Sesamum angolense]
MAQLHGMRGWLASRGISVRSMLNYCSLVSKHRVENQMVERTQQRAILGLHTMTVGEGPLSYAQNSSYQETLYGSKYLSISDNNLFENFGCSTGHNSFLAMQMITRSLQQNFNQKISFSNPDFYMYFNDQVTNDFNTLFRSLPPERHYQAVGLPGDYHRRLLPKASLHFAYSSWALHWLSQVPTAVADPNSPAWNKGRVLYLGARPEVVDAYSSQHAKDTETFLEARAQELVSGGLMVLVLPGVIPTSAENSNTSYTDIPTEIALIGSCLTDMAKKGELAVAHIGGDDDGNAHYFGQPVAPFCVGRRRRLEGRQRWSPPPQRLWLAAAAT